MRKLFLIFSSLCCLMALSQETYVYKGNGNVLNSKGEAISPAEMRSLLFDNEMALELYNAGRSKKTAGNILLYGGLAAGISFIVYEATRTVEYSIGPNGIPKFEDSTPITPLIIAGTAIIISIPIKIGFSKKIKQAVALMNNPAPKQTSFIDESSILINQNGIGLAVRF